jgi:hypothetical protein
VLRSLIVATLFVASCARVDPYANVPSTPFTRTETFRNVERGLDGALWGLARDAVWRTSDRGATWQRFDLPVDHCWRFCARTSDSFWVDAADAVWIWWPLEKRTEKFVQFDGHVSLVILRRGPLWLAHGTRYLDEAARERNSAHFDFESADVDDTYVGIVLGSADAGAHWTELLTVPRGGILTLDWQLDGTLATFANSGTFSRGKLTIEDGTPRVAWQSGRARPPRSNYASELVFHGEKRGWFTGDAGFGAEVAVETYDGGRTWSAVRGERPGTSRPERLASGALIARGWGAGAQGETGYVDLAIWRGESLEQLHHFDSPIDASLLVTAGRACFQLENGAVWELAPDDATWTELLPPR